MIVWLEQIGIPKLLLKVGVCMLAIYQRVVLLGHEFKNKRKCATLDDVDSLFVKVLGYKHHRKGAILRSGSKWWKKNSLARSPLPLNQQATQELKIRRVVVKKHHESVLTVARTVSLQLALHGQERFLQSALHL